MSEKRTGIFGGSLNPIHYGHIALAKRIMQLDRLDEVWFMVSPHNPLKSSGSLLPDAERLDMVRLALEGEPGLIASDYEFRLPKPSYTLHTLNAIRHDYPDRKFVLIIGADNWKCFDRWYGYKEILADYEIAVYPRLGSHIDAGRLPHKVTLVDTGHFNEISTEIRTLLSEGKPADNLMPPQVTQYIKTNHLFGTKR